MSKVCFTHYQNPAPLPVQRLTAGGYGAALEEVQRALAGSDLPPLDAVIHGVAVRLYSDNLHWRRFWLANWFAPNQWATLTTGVPLLEPRVHLYAPSAPAKTEPWAGYNRDKNTAFLRGDTPYGPLRALTLTVVARVLAEEQAVHFLPAMCVKTRGRGTLVVYAPEIGLTGAIQRLLEIDDLEILALDGLFVRYGLVRMVDGVTMLPMHLIDEKGRDVPGYRLFAWLDAYGYREPRADTRCLTLQGEEEYCFARDLDLGRDPEAFAYPFEQAWYVPTQLVATDPDLIGALWLTAESGQTDEPESLRGCGGLENVPPLTAGLREQFGNWAREAVSSLGARATASTRSLLDEIGPEQTANALCRLRASSDARAIAPPQQMWGMRAGGHPHRPVLIEQVLHLDEAGLTPLDPAAFSAHFGPAGAHLDPSEEDEITGTLVALLRRAT